jgi:hypothetical protein
MSIKNVLIDNIKNVIGWKTKRKLIIFSVDDYGNVRLDSKNALDNMLKAGLKIQSRFDAYDALENTADLEMLYDALSSVRDKNGHHAVFTPFAIPCNINFEKMSESGFDSYTYELLPETFSKLKGYEKTWDLWKEGIVTGLMKPQFHGREHFNLKVFEEKFMNKDEEVIAALQNRSLACISSSGYSSISYTAAFEFWDFNENSRLKEIIEDGLLAFENVFGYKALNFNAPGGREHPVIHESLKSKGVKYIDTPWIKNEHLGLGKFKKIINYTGKKNHINQTYLVRNVVFEPTANDGIDWVNYTLNQIQLAFRWNRPAIISSHRVNFCGHIDENNRSKGIQALKELLKKIINRWPDIEFITADKLGDIISNADRG